MSKQYRMSDAAPGARGMVVKRSEIERVVEDDDDPDLSWLEQDYEGEDIPPEERARYRAADAERLAAYNRGDWHMIGIKARASFLIPHGGAFIRQTVESPGLWGIESDGGEDYFAETFSDERETLEDMLKAMGVTVED